MVTRDTTNHSSGARLSEQECLIDDGTSLGDLRHPGDKKYSKNLNSFIGSAPKRLIDTIKDLKEASITKTSNYDNLHQPYSINEEEFSDHENNYIDHDNNHKFKRSHRSVNLMNVRLTTVVYIALIVSGALLVVRLLTKSSRDDGEIPEALRRQDYLLIDKQLRAGQELRWVVSNPRCHIPNLAPWDKSIKSYVHVKPTLNCSQIYEKNLAHAISAKSLTYNLDNRLHFTPEAIEMGALNGSCCYKLISRDDQDDNSITVELNCTKITQDHLNLDLPLIEVSCPSLNYTNVHSFVVRNKLEEDSLDRLAKLKLKDDEHYNVVFLGLDTISRLNGYRQLSQSLAVLEKMYKTIEFTGYNKVGENTFPNLIPLLTGLKSEQLVETQCWLSSNYTDERESGDDYLDNCKYLWSFYREFGYTTYFSEDWPKASTFNYLKMGFKREPTEFYGRPYTIARDQLLLPPVSMGCSSCQLDKPIVHLDLENLRMFIKNNSDRPHFAFHWINCPQHDDLNGASQVDSIVAQFLTSIHRWTQDKTFVVFFSDHGYRWNNFVSTRIGHYESSLPMLTIAPPKSFIDKHPDLYENLVAHQRALITPFDLFKTIIAIRDLGERRKGAQKLKPSMINRSSLAPVYSSATDIDAMAGPTAATTMSQETPLDGITYHQGFKTISLLDDHDDEQLDRSCIDAGIPDNFCVCHGFTNVHTSRLDVKGAAYFFVYEHLYSRIKKRKDICAMLDIDTIQEAQVHNFDILPKSHIKTTTKRPKSYTRQTIETSNSGQPVSRYRVTTEQPTSDRTNDDSIIDEENQLPRAEFNIRLMTKPGGALFQEVIRIYGNDTQACNKAVIKTKDIIEDSNYDVTTKHSSVMIMNKACKFSIHSGSISRLNLYKDQSKCVTRNDIELKKICLCDNITHVAHI